MSQGKKLIGKSKIFRVGVFTDAPIQEAVLKEVLDTGETQKTPFLCFEMESEIPIGDKTPWVEKTNVVLYGAEPVKWWKSLAPVPGDNIILENPVAYVNKGTLCCRVTSPDEIQVIHMEDGIPTESAADTKEFIMQADDFFRRLFTQILVERKRSNYESL